MATIQAEIKRGVLRTLFRGVDATTGLQKVLEAFQTGGFNAIKSGKLLIGSSGAGHSVSFSIPTTGTQWTQDNVFALSEELLQIFDDALVTLAAATPPNVAPDDVTIFATMKADDRMQTIRSVQQDNTALRFPSYGVTR